MTTAIQRHQRRRDVIEMHIGRKMTPAEIAEELDCSPRVVHADLKYIEERIGDEEGVFRNDVKMAAQNLLDHELQDLADADTLGEIDVKNATKTSLRNTLRFLNELADDYTTESTTDVDELLENASEETKAKIDEVGEELIVEVLDE